MILDEPTSALDLDGLNKLYKILNDFRALKKTIIIGSGLSGLSCAHYLDKKKFDVKIYEKESYLGGRVATEDVNGFKCDVGFQVLLNNYEEVKKIGVYDKLDLKYFSFF